MLADPGSGRYRPRDCLILTEPTRGPQRPEGLRSYLRKDFRPAQVEAQVIVSHLKNRRYNIVNWRKLGAIALRINQSPIL